MVEALRRSNELGLLFGNGCVHDIMVKYGEVLDVDAVEQIWASLPDGGLVPTAKTGYILIRTCINAGEVDKATSYAQAMASSGVRLKASTLQLLRAGQAAKQAAEPAGAIPEGSEAADDQAATQQQPPEAGTS